MAIDKVDVKLGLDLTDFKAGITQVDAAFDKAKGAAKKSTDSMAQGINAMNKELKLTETEIVAATNQIKKWERELKGATDKHRIDELKKSIHNTKKELEGVNVATKKADKEIRTFADSAKEQFGRIGTAIVAAFAFHAIKQFVGESIHAFKEQEEALIRLEMAYGNNKQGFDEMIAAAKDFQEKLNIPDEVFMTQAAFLKSQGRTNEEIKKIIKTAQGLKTALGTDLQTAVLQINETFDGSIGRLGKFSVGMDKLTKEELANGDAVTLLEKTYGSLAEEMAGTTLGQTEKAALNFNNLQEVIGGTVIKLLEEINLLPQLNKELEAITTGLENKYIPAWEKFASFFGGDITQLDNATKIQKAAMERLIIIAENGSEKEKLIAKTKIEGLIRYDEKFKEMYIDIYNERHKKVQKETEKHVDKIVTTEKKGVDEIAKANEELLKRLRGLEIENTKDKVEQIRMRALEDIKDVEKSKGSAETKAKIIVEINKKMYSDIENQEKEHQLKMQTIVEQGNKEYIKEIEDRLTGFQERSEEVKSELSDKEQSDLDLANFFGIEVDSKEDIDKLKETLSETLDVITNYVNQALENYVRLKEGAVQAKSEQIEENMRMLEFEQKQEELGYANNVSALKKRDAQLKAEREKAQKELEKAKEQQLAVDTALQVSSLITAAAKIIAADVHPALAAIEIAAMVAAFALAQTQANEAVKGAKFEKGGTWVEGGRRHTQGGNKYGNVEVEEGERMAVFNRNATQKNSGLSSLIESINKGQLVIDKDKMNSLVAGNSNVIVNVAGQKELSEIRDLIYQQGINDRGSNYKRFGKNGRGTMTIYKN